MSSHDDDSPRSQAGPWWSHPPSLPATSRGRRGADKALRSVDSSGRLGLLALVLAFVLAFVLPDGIGIWFAGVLYLAVGLYCSVNFWRCREAHCVITGGGFTVLGLAVLAAAVGMPTVIAAYASPIVLGILVLAVAFETTWRARYGTKAVHLPHKSGADTPD